MSGAASPELDPFLPSTETLLLECTFLESPISGSPIPRTAAAPATPSFLIALPQNPVVTAAPGSDLLGEATGDGVCSDPFMVLVLEAGAAVEAGAEATVDSLDG